MTDNQTLVLVLLLLLLVNQGLCSFTHFQFNPIQCVVW